MPQSNGQAVPKFGSFSSRKLKRKPEEEQRRQDDITKEHSHSGSQSRHHHDSENQLPKRVGSTLDRQGSAKQDDISDFFCIDVRGDPKNVEYGSLHRYSVPLYHRSGKGSVIGAPSHVKIDRNASADTGIVFRDDSLARLATSTVSQKQEMEITTETMLPRIPSSEEKGELQRDYLSLTRKRSSDRPRGEAGIWAFIQDASFSEDEDDLEKD